MWASWWLRFLLLAGGMTLARYGNGWMTAILTGLVCVVGIFRVTWRKTAAVCGICLLFGFGWYRLQVPEIPEFLTDTDEKIWTGRVADYRQNTEEESDTWILKTDTSIPWAQRISVRSYCENPVQNGDRVEITGALKLPRRPRNPGEFDYARYLADQGIFYTLSVYKAEAVRVVEPAKESGFSLSRWREKRMETVKNLLPQEAPLLLGMILGWKENIPDEEYAAFQKTGTVHLLAVSGLHVGFLLLFAEFLLRRLKIGKGKKRAIEMLFLLGYGTLTGWPVTIQRAVFMTGLGLLALQWGRMREPLDILGLSGVIILLFSPTAPFGISMQLSFAAVWGILVLLPVLTKLVPWKNRLVTALLLPVAVEIAILPISMYHFQLCSVSSLFVNPFAVWLGAGIILLGLLGFFAASFGTVIAGIFLYPAGWMLKLLTVLVQEVSELNGSYFHTPQPPLLLLFLYYLLLGAAFLTNEEEGRKWKRLFAMGAVGVWLLLFLPHSWADGNLHLTFLDVGQGNCAILTTPSGKNWMIDGGGSEFYDLGASIPVPWLHRQGIREIEWMVSTHPDTDHLQGLIAAAREVKVKNLLLPDALKEAEEYRPLLRLVQEHGGNIWYGVCGESWHPETGMTAEVWYPAKGQGKSRMERDTVNEESLIFCVRYADFSLLIPGDAGADSLRAMLKTKAAHPVTLLEVPHHGSRNSYCPEFYEAVRPELAVVQSKSGNSYGHPHAEVVDYLAEQKIPLLRTDESGCITVEVTEKGIRIETFFE